MLNGSQPFCITLAYFESRTACDPRYAKFWHRSRFDFDLLTHMQSYGSGYAPYQTPESVIFFDVSEGLERLRHHGRAAAFHLAQGNRAEVVTRFSLIAYEAAEALAYLARFPQPGVWSPAFHYGNTAPVLC